MALTGMAGEQAPGAAPAAFVPAESGWGLSIVFGPETGRRAISATKVVADVLPSLARSSSKDPKRVQSARSESRQTLQIKAAAERERICGDATCFDPENGGIIDEIVGRPPVSRRNAGSWIAHLAARRCRARRERELGRGNQDSRHADGGDEDEEATRGWATRAIKTATGGLGGRREDARADERPGEQRDGCEEPIERMGTQSGPLQQS